MTPADEISFVALWQQGLETAAIAQALGIPPGTARSRAYTCSARSMSSRHPPMGTPTRSGPTGLWGRCWGSDWEPG